jgi:hypothetical protein
MLGVYFEIFVSSLNHFSIAATCLLMPESHLMICVNFQIVLGPIFLKIRQKLTMNGAIDWGRVYCQ